MSYFWWTYLRNNIRLARIEQLYRDESFDVARNKDGMIQERGKIKMHSAERWHGRNDVLRQRCEDPFGQCSSLFADCRLQVAVFVPRISRLPFTFFCSVELRLQLSTVPNYTNIPYFHQTQPITFCQYLLLPNHIHKRFLFSSKLFLNIKLPFLDISSVKTHLLFHFTFCSLISQIYTKPSLFFFSLSPSSH